MRAERDRDVVCVRRWSWPRSRLASALAAVGLLLVGALVEAVPADAGSSAPTAGVAAYGSQEVVAPLGLTNSFGLALGPQGDVFVIDTGHDRVVRYPADSSAKTVLPFVGLSGPQQLAVGPTGDVIVSDTGNARVVVLPASGAGYGPQETLPFTGLIGPQGVAVGPSGEVVVVDGDYATVPRVLALAKAAGGYGSQETLPITGVGGSFGPQGAAVDTAGNVYVASYDGSSGSIVQLPKRPAGWGAQIVIPVSGVSTLRGLAVDGSGNLFAADPFGDKVVKLTDTANGYEQTTLPFTGLDAPEAVAVDPVGNVFVAAGIASRVLKLPATATGYGTQVLLPYAGPSEPRGAVLDADGNLFVADTAGDQVLRLAKTADGYGPPVALPFTSLFGPSSVAVDLDGNVFASNASTGPGTAKLVELPRVGNGYGPEVTIPVTTQSYSSGLQGVAVDGAGNLFVTERGNGSGRVLTFSRQEGGFGPQATVPFTGLVGAVDIIITPAGDVVVTDAGDGSGRVIRLAKTPAGYGAQSTLPFGDLRGPVGVAIGPGGSVLVRDSILDAVIELPVAGDGFGTPSTLPFVGMDGVGDVVVEPEGDVIATGNFAREDASVVRLPVGDAPPVVLVQGAPTSATVTAGTPYAGQLAMANASGAVTYTVTSSPDSERVAVSSSGAISAGGSLPVGSYTVGGSARDAAGRTGPWTFTLRVVAAPAPTAPPTTRLTQGAPTSAAVPTGSAYRSQLTVTNATGPVVFSATESKHSQRVLVSASGAVSAAGTLAPGTYDVAGTMTDSAGRRGRWSFVLTVTAMPPRVLCRRSAVPSGWVVTRVIAGRPGCGANNQYGFNAIEVRPAHDGIVACAGAGLSAFPGSDGFVITRFVVGRPECGRASSYRDNAAVLTVLADGVFKCVNPQFPYGAPDGYEVSGLAVLRPGCRRGGSGAFNAVELQRLRDGSILCGGSRAYPFYPFRTGYVVTRVGDHSGCRTRGPEDDNYNAFQLSVVRDGVVACNAVTQWPFHSRPDGYVVTRVMVGPCGPADFYRYNAVQLSRPRDGIIACTGRPQVVGVPRPPGFRVAAEVYQPGCGPADFYGRNAVRLEAE